LARFSLGPFLGQELYGDQTADHGVVSASDSSSGAGTDNFQDFVASDLHVITLRQMALLMR